MHQIAPALMKLAVPIDSIHELPGNPRQGDDAAVQRSLIQFGQLKPIVVRADTRDIVAGNTTWRGARAAGWDKIAALVTEMDDATAAAFALADNRTHDLGTYDDAALAALIASLQSDSDAGLLAATGYNEEDFAALVISTAAPNFQPATEAAVLDTTPPKECPHCGGLFRLDTHGTVAPA